MPYLCIFGLEFYISTSNLSKTNFLTHTVNFGIGSTYSKGVGSAFSEVPSPGLGKLCKVCQFYLYLSNKNKTKYQVFIFIVEPLNFNYEPLIPDFQTSSFESTYRNVKRLAICYCINFKKLPSKQTYIQCEQ